MSSTERTQWSPEAVSHASHDALRELWNALAAESAAVSARVAADVARGDELDSTPELDDATWWAQQATATVAEQLAIVVSLLGDDEIAAMRQWAAANRKSIW